MKNTVNLMLLLILLNCAKKTESNSLEPLKIEHIDNIPYLMRTMKIDSVFEILESGKVIRSNTSDTITRYYIDAHKNNIIHEKIHSLMCCHNEYVFDSLNFLTNKTVFSDYIHDTKYR